MQLTFTVNTKAPVATKGLAGVDANSLMVLAYDTDGNFISELPILKTSEENSTVKFLCNFNAALPVTSGADNAPSYKFVVLTNSTNQQYGMSYDSNGVPQIESLDFSYPFQSTVPMWGVKTYTLKYGTDGKVLETQELGQIDVLRSAAKVGVRLSDELKAEGYKIKDIKINYVSGSGYSVPANWNTVDATDKLTAADGFRPASGVSLTDVSAFSVSEQAGYEGMHYIYIPEIKNDEELAMAITFLKDGEEIPFTYENGIKFRTYLEGMPTDEKFNVVRNHFYDYRVTAINTSIELEMIEYETLPWIPEEVEIGGEVKYLVLNTDLVKIYSENVDATTLKFTSSSPIASVVLKDTYTHDLGTSKFEKGTDGVSAYYVGKFGQKTQLGDDPGFPMTDQEAALEKEQDILAHISAEAEQDVLQGGITITSPFMADPENEISELKDDSHYNTVRYLEFEVTNQQGLTEIFRVEQYPPTVINNIEGYFSYRDDFTRQDGEEPAYWTNYMGVGSVTTMGIILNHEHDWTNEANQSDAWFATRQSDRSYAWTTACETTGKGEERWEEMRYSMIAHYVNFKNASGKETSAMFSGGYRPYEPSSPIFFRERYKGLPGATNMDTKGAAVSYPYEKEITLADGTTETRTFRKHYTWDIQTIYWSKYVKKVHQEDSEITVSGTKYKRLKGQANIYSISDNYTIYKDGGDVYNPEDVVSGGGNFVDYSIGKLWKNHRMYHIKATTTSDKYTFGRPTLVDEEGNPTTDADRGVVDHVPSNANLVSPSLMLASQLGETDYNYIIANCKQYNYNLPKLSDFYTLAKNHCREYVESTWEDTNGNGQPDEGEPVTQYHDWRLPTKAEIEMIIDFQSNSRAMDVVLIGEHFVCITGQPGQGDNEEYWVSSEVPTYKVSPEDDIDGRGYTNTGYYIRCVRDVYED